MPLTIHGGAMLEPLSRLVFVVPTPPVGPAVKRAKPAGAFNWFALAVWMVNVWPATRLAMEVAAKVAVPVPSGVMLTVPKPPARVPLRPKESWPRVCVTSRFGAPSRLTVPPLSARPALAPQPLGARPLLPWPVYTPAVLLSKISVPPGRSATVS